MERTQKVAYSNRLRPLDPATLQPIPYDTLLPDLASRKHAIKVPIGMWQELASRSRAMARKSDEDAARFRERVSG